MPTEVTPSGFFVLRTPLLPFAELEEWTNGMTARGAWQAGADPAVMEQHLLADRALLRERLRALIQRPEIMEALFVASADLVESLEVWVREPDSKRGRKLERGLIRYFARMASRPTPFGLFAGYSIGQVGGGSALELASRASYRRFTRLDHDFFTGITHDFREKVPRSDGVTYRLNSSLYPTSTGYRLTEVHQEPRGRSFKLASLEGTPYLDQVLACARDGATHADLAQLLVEPEISLEEAGAFIDELIAAQVLCPDCEAPLTSSGSSLAYLASYIRSHPSRLASPAARSVLDIADAALHSMEALDQQGLGVDPARYRAVVDVLRGLKEGAEPGNIFQVDMAKPAARLELGAAVMRVVQEGIDLLHRITPPSPPSQRLQRFRERFQERYSDAEVPLMLALDAEAGIGYDDPLARPPEAETLVQDVGVPEAGYGTIGWGSREKHLLHRLEGLKQQRQAVLELTDADVAALETAHPAPLPDAFHVTGILAAQSSETLEAGKCELFVQYVTGPSGGRVLSRFCQADPELTAAVTGHLRAEEALQPGARFAELVHLPRGRLANVTARPVLRELEIPFLGTSGAPAEHQVPITDLTIRIEDGQVRLRSKSRGIDIIPRITNAHAASNHGDLALYRLMQDLQFQGIMATAGWRWGALKDLPFLPRVQHGRIVLSLARWRLSPAEQKALVESQETDRFALVQELRERRGVPRWVGLADGDHVLVTDLDSGLAVDAMIQCLKDQSEPDLVELFPAPDRLCVTGPEGRFRHELIIPFVRTRSAARAPARPARHTAVTIQQNFAPGSEWLYLKLYGGSNSADRVLLETIHPLVERACAAQVIDRWFFIRYADPEPHLRIRLHGSPDRLQRELLPALFQASHGLLERGALWRIQLDTYQRETRRYGGPESIELAEALFKADSDAVCDILTALPGIESVDARWQAAALGLHRMLDDFGIAPAAREGLLASWRDGMLAGDPDTAQPIRIQLGRKFRLLRGQVLAAISGGATAPQHGWQAIETALAERSARSAAPIRQLVALEQQGRLTATRAQLAGSCAHMFLNRLLRPSVRLQELALYDLLARTYLAEGKRSAGAERAAPSLVGV